MNDNTSSRKMELYEYVTTTHMLCIVVAVCALILSNKHSISITSIIPRISLRLFALSCLIGFAAVLLYNSKKILLSKGSQSFTLIDLAYIMVSFLVVLSTVYVTGDSVPYIYAILILPIIITASSIGKTAGLIAATVSTVFLVIYNIMSGRSFSIAGALESNLILIMIMYIVGWFIGGLRDIEAQHRKQLETNFNKLKEEIKRREQAEEQLRKLSSALEQSPSIAVITDTGGNIEYVNQKFTGVTGYLPVEVIGKNMFEEQYGRSPEKHKEILDTINSGQEWREELLNKKKNGEYYWEHMSISPFRNIDGEITHFIKMAEDVTERKSIDVEMARLDRLNLVGEMAAGIGHEIRNPMTTVKGFLQLFREKKEFANYSEQLDLMVEEIDRANSIITEFLSLAKNKAIDLNRRSLNKIIRSLYPLIQADAMKSDKNITLELEDIPMLFLDEKEMRQVILNLVRNGLEAMQPGGNLTVRTYNEEREVVLSVQDQGTGIKPELLEKLGTPFFTTKDNGTGLGLAVCYSLAARHSARIDVISGPAGTTFYVRFKVKN